MLEATLYDNYSTGGCMETTQDANHFTVEMLETNLNAKYSIQGMLDTTSQS